MSRRSDAQRLVLQGQIHPRPAVMPSSGSTGRGHDQALPAQLGPTGPVVLGAGDDCGLSGSSSLVAGRDNLDESGICLLRIAKGVAGESDTKLLATLILLRVLREALARASRTREERRPIRIYIDELQSCSSQVISTLLAEARKFGIALVLANQSLSQLESYDGRRDIARSALGNAANLISFRVGAPDAERLAPWFEPEIDRWELCGLPDFHAAVRVLEDGRPRRPAILRTLRPPNAPEGGAS